MTNSIQTIKTAGKDIRVGDMLKLWFGLSRVIAFRPYNGDTYPEGFAIVAQFDNGKEMTIARNDWLEVVA